MDTLLTRTCVLCPAKIRPTYRLCLPCYRQYGQYMNEQWFKDLEQKQAEQDAIDTREGFTIPYSAQTDIEGNNVATDTGIAGGKPVGRPETKAVVVDQVLAIYDESVENGKPLSLRKIAGKLGNKVSYNTIRNILKEKRKLDYTKQ